MAHAPVETVTSLQRQLAWRIAEHLRAEGLNPGDPVNQLALAHALGVSRTPVRKALEWLAEAGLVRMAPRGVVMADPAVTIAAPALDDAGSDALITRMARDRHSGALPPDVSEADLMRRYGASRTVLLEALRRLANLGMVMRKPGFGWRFLVGGDTQDERAASYRFRLAVEPAALLEPDYRPDPRWIAQMREAHHHYLATPWRNEMAVPFFEMNASFHIGLVSFSGNRFFVQAAEQQISLRRLRNYSWSTGEERMRASCGDHLGILEALAEGNHRQAAKRLRQHLIGTAEASRAAHSGPTDTAQFLSSKVSHHEHDTQPPVPGRHDTASRPRSPGRRRMGPAL